MYRLDNFLIRVTEKILNFLADWFSISQSQVERFFASLYLFSSLALSAIKLWEGDERVGVAIWLFLFLVVYAGMRAEMKLSTQERCLRRLMRHRFRIVLFVAVGAFTAVGVGYIAWFRRFDIGYWVAVLQAAAMLWFDYTIVANPRPPGRRRARTLIEQAREKLRGIVVPVPVPA